GQAIIPTSQFTINALQIVLVPIPHSGKRSFRPPRSQCPRPDYLLVPIPHSGKRSFRPSIASVWSTKSTVPIPHSGKRSFRQQGIDAHILAGSGSNPSL